MTVDLAVRLATEAEFYVFPVGADKKPLTSDGFKSGTTDPDRIEQMWDEHPDALIGVYTGASEIVVLDIDYKERDGVVVDGFESLEDAWVEIPPSFAYDSTSGNGRHIVYQAPEGKVLNGVAGYRKMPGVDRRAGGSYVVWNSRDVPTELTDAPEWLCDEAALRTLQTFEGDLEDWYENLTPGAPNELVKRAIARVRDDFSHSDMVAAQHEAIRLGAEGNPGVLELLEALEEAFLNRNPAYHVTPQEEWAYKFTESLVSGVQKYGALTELITQMPPYSLSIVPASIKDSELTGSAQSTPGLTNLINRMIRETDIDARIASILWNAPATQTKAREWGVEFLYRRIAEARTSKAPIDENPAVEEDFSEPDHSTSVEELPEPSKKGGLLTDDERSALRYFKRFDDEYLAFARQDGFANEVYTRAGAWGVLSMAMAFRAFIPVTPTDKLGVNLWTMVMGYSGTGKSVSIKFRDQVLDRLFSSDGDDETGYNLGHDSSVSGLHEALLGRDRQASFFGADEAAGFFKNLNRDGWQTGTDDTLSRWYDGRIDPSNKVRLKDLRGKSATTSLTIQMYATPERLVDSLTRDQFKSGFLARFNWVVGDPPSDSDDRFKLQQQVGIVDFEETPESIEQIAVALLGRAMELGEKSTPILATDEALDRMGRAYKEMFSFAKDRTNWDIIEPSITRLVQAMRKVAALNALNRGETTIELVDAVNAIAVIEEWYLNLFSVANKISQGAFQRGVAKIEAWLRGQEGGRATKKRLYHAFKNDIEKDGRELDMRIQFMLESGSVIRKEYTNRTEFLINE